MGVTSNYSFPVPVATDLVKNGWDAINDLGVAVDTAMNTALGTKKAGMVLLNTTSFSAVSAQSVSNVLSTNYRNYKIVLDLVASGAAGMRIRFRKASTDITTSIYQRQYIFAGSTTVTGARNTDTSLDIGGISTQKFFATFDFNYPNTTSFVAGSGQASTYANSTSNEVYVYNFGTTSTIDADGLNFYPTGGTITGSVSVYGYNL
jgi:hypothetical protein